MPAMRIEFTSNYINVALTVSGIQCVSNMEHALTDPRVFNITAGNNVANNYDELSCLPDATVLYVAMTPA